MEQIGFSIMSVPHDSDDGVSHLETLSQLVPGVRVWNVTLKKRYGIVIRVDVERANHPPI
jgi:hypothetical protein